MPSWLKFSPCIVRRYFSDSFFFVIVNANKKSKLFSNSHFNTLLCLFHDIKNYTKTHFNSIESVYTSLINKCLCLKYRLVFHNLI